jgi:chromosome segregation ATPase
MRIHRIKLCNFKGVTDCEIDIPADGVTIIEGDNEAGKSSMAEALRLVFKELDSSKKASIRAAQPVGRDVGPEVEAEVSSGIYRFVYRKRWLRRPETELEIIEPRHEQLVHREAHERVDAMLDETLDRVLWDALWVDQGVQLRTPAFDVPSLRQSLDASAGGTKPGDADDLLWNRICDERARYWTPTGRLSAERATQQQQCKQAAETAEGLRKQLNALSGAVEDFDGYRQKESQLVEAHTLAARQHQELDVQWGQVETLRDQRDHAGHQLKTAQAQLTTEEGRRAQRNELIERLNAAERDLTQSQAEIDAVAPSLARANQLYDEAAADFEAARHSLENAESGLRRAQDDRDYLRRIIDAELLQERHERVEIAQGQLAQAERTLDSNRITKETVDEIERAYERVVQADARTLSGAANVQVSALQPIPLDLGDEVLQLEPAESHSLAVTDSLDIKIADVATLRVSAGAETRDSAAALTTAQDDLRRLLTSVDVSDPAEARAALRQHESAESERERAKKTIKQDLRDLTVEVLEQKLRGLRHGIDEYRKTRPDEPPLPADYEAARTLASELEEQFNALNQTRRDRESRLAECGEARANERVREAGAARGLQRAQEAKAHAETALAEARSEQSDQAIEGAYRDAKERFDNAERDLSTLESKLREADEESLEGRRDNAHSAAQRAEKELYANRQRQSELRIELDIRGEEGLHTKYGLAEATLRRLERQHQSLESRAEAAHLLHETLSRHREAAHRRYQAPFKARIDELGRHVFGPTFAVELDNELGLARRTLDGVTLNVDQLSTGAREQLGILARLACAAIVSPTASGAPVIIDDALGWSDPSRLERMGAAIASAGNHCQLIILTCTPGRYAHVGNAAVRQLITSPNNKR